MKSKSNTGIVSIVIIFILIIFILFCALFIQSNTPDYSVLNKGNNGFSVLSDTLKELKYPVGRSLTNIKDTDIKNIQIVGYGGNFNLEDEELKAWIGKGGILIYAVPYNSQIPTYAGLPKLKDDLVIYHYKEGTIITLDASNITNRALTKDTSHAYKLINEIDTHYYNSIYFNENSLFSMQDTTTIWDYIPLPFKFIIYQFLIALVAFFYFKGKRFGKAGVLYDEVERRENDYLYSAAGLYRQAKCYDLMLESYYMGFVRGMNKTQDDWLAFWEREELPHLDKANKVYNIMKNIDKKLNSKEYLNIINIIEDLNNVVKKRRELYWKKMKVSQ